jgi:hypothetical protein
MYKISKTKNNVTKLEQRLFKELHIREREHLQEWIANNPEMLGEELLIIQKEFDGFNDTHERLDLLALDKDQGLVIIENKLDDTGRNVVWQALKYTSYCSTLTTNQLITIFQDFLKSNGVEEDAKETILDFLEIEEEDLLLNRNDQRIIFVSNTYRKEVTSTVLWLLDHDIQIQCFRAIPYSMGDETFLHIEQIIPLPETKEFMIDVKEKEKQEKTISKAVEERSAALVEFWSKAKADFKSNGFHLIDNVTAKPMFSIGSWKGRGKFSYCIGRNGLRIELYFGNDADKSLFDAMYNHKEELEAGFNGGIYWERLDNKKASRIKYEIQYTELNINEGKFTDKANWSEWIEWFRKTMPKFYNHVYPIWDKVQKEI